MNVAVALQTFVAEADRGKCIKILCDNMASVQVLQSGRGRNRAILEAARAAWMVQALYQVTIVYEHIPGRLNFLADALSRAHESYTKNDIAKQLVHDLGLNWVQPCTHLFSDFKSLLSRPRADNPGDRSALMTRCGESAGHQRKPNLSSTNLPQVLSYSPLASPIPDSSDDVHVHRAPESSWPGPTHCEEQCGSHQDLSSTRWSPTSRLARTAHTSYP